MRIWIDNIGGISVNFQPDSKEESELLDKLLGFDYKNAPVEISNDRDVTIEQGAKVFGEMDGHESQRWIHIKPVAIKGWLDPTKM